MYPLPRPPCGHSSAARLRTISMPGDPSCPALQVERAPICDFPVASGGRPRMSPSSLHSTATFRPPRQTLRDVLGECRTAPESGLEPPWSVRDAYVQPVPQLWHVLCRSVAISSPLETEVSAQPPSLFSKLPPNARAGAAGGREIRGALCRCRRLGPVAGVEDGAGAGALLSLGQNSRVS